MLEVGDIDRFPTVGDYSSYCRCVKSERFSNGKKKGNGNRKNGNKYLAWAYIEAANFAIRYCPYSKTLPTQKSQNKRNSWYQGIKQQTGQGIILHHTRSGTIWRKKTFWLIILAAAVNRYRGWSKIHKMWLESAAANHTARERLFLKSNSPTSWTYIRVG